MMVLMEKINDVITGPNNLGLLYPDKISCQTRHSRPRDFQNLSHFSGLNTPNARFASAYVE